MAAKLTEAALPACNFEKLVGAGRPPRTFVGLCQENPDTANPSIVVLTSLLNKVQHPPSTLVLNANYRLAANELAASEIRPKTDCHSFFVVSTKHKFEVSVNPLRAGS